MTKENIILEGARVRLEPLGFQHHIALCEGGLDPELWKWIPVQIDSADHMRKYISEAIAQRNAGCAYPFATIEKRSNRAVGSTRFMALELSHRRLEIGSTWIASRWQRTVVNTEAKFLMLKYAFETLKCNRVELKTDALNEKSRRAILRIGATEEGTFRKHMVTQSGRVRDTIYFSIIDSEWPVVKERLIKKIERL